MLIVQKATPSIIYTVLTAAFTLPFGVNVIISLPLRGGLFHKNLNIWDQILKREKNNSSINSYVFGLIPTPVQTTFMITKTRGFFYFYFLFLFLVGVMFCVCKFLLVFCFATIQPDHDFMVFMFFFSPLSKVSCRSYFQFYLTLI